METVPAARYSEEFKEQVVREVIEKERTISSVASSYDLVPQTVGSWVARYRKDHATDQDRKKASRHPMPTTVDRLNCPSELKPTKADFQVIQPRLVQPG